MGEDDIRNFRVECRGFDGKAQAKPVAPVTCRACSAKSTCRAVQALLGAESDYSKRFKGTILENGMLGVGRVKKEIADFILNGTTLL